MPCQTTQQLIVVTENLETTMADTVVLILISGFIKAAFPAVSCIAVLIAVIALCVFVKTIHITVIAIAEAALVVAAKNVVRRFKTVCHY